jgi:DNA-binding NarL/FixJ family response regulator
LENSTLFIKRSRPHIIVLVNDCTVLYAEAEAQRYVNANLLAAIQKGKLRFHYRDAIVAVSKRADSSLTVLYVEERRRRRRLETAAAQYNLTSRQLSIVRLLMRGMRIADIASELSLSEPTVAEHVRRLLAKTRTKNRAALVACLLGYNTPSETGMGDEACDFYTRTGESSAFGFC